MKPTIVSQRENPLLKRKELEVSVESEGATPKKEELASAISTALNVDKKLVVVDSLRQSFGSKESRAYVKVYNSEKDLKEIEPPVKEKKEKKPKAEEGEAKPESGEVKPPEGEAPKEEKKEEAPKEEKVKEKKEEPKPEEKEEVKPDEQKEQ